MTQPNAAWLQSLQNGMNGASVPFAAAKPTVPTLTGGPFAAAAALTQPTVPEDFFEELTKGPPQGDAPPDVAGTISPFATAATLTPPSAPAEFFEQLAQSQGNVEPSPAGTSALFAPPAATSSAAPAVEPWGSGSQSASIPAKPATTAAASDAAAKFLKDFAARRGQGTTPPGPIPATAATAPSAAPAAATDAAKFLKDFAARHGPGSAPQGSSVPATATTAPQAAASSAAPAATSVSSLFEGPPSVSAAASTPVPNGASSDAPGEIPPPAEAPAPQEQPNGAGSPPTAVEGGTPGPAPPLAPMGVPLPPMGQMGPPPPGASAPFAAAAVANEPKEFGTGASPLTSWTGSAARVGAAPTEQNDKSSSFGIASADFFSAGGLQPSSGPGASAAADPFANPKSAPSAPREGLAALFD
ncbi:unnamed protein product [Symbiodinium sp. CCMP2592]|nr:unnamed protein product [Symbiodinium sp. CCMP2592]